MADQGKSKAGEQQTGGIPPLEWAVALVGLVLVAGIIGFLLYQASLNDNSAPDITLTVSGITEGAGGYLVEFNVQNHGGRTVARLVVVGELRRSDEVVEVSQVEIDYVPAKSERSGGFFFSENPADYELALRPLGFQEP
jgi:uncharacterized protein (TIGR02588 family)